jgi:hypothetical protein
MAGGEIEILVFDNSKNQDSMDVFSSEIGPKVVVRSWQDIENKGFAMAINELAREARSPWLLVLNPDVFLTPRSLKSLLDLIESQPDCDVYGVCLRRPNGSKYSGIGLNSFGLLTDLKFRSASKMIGPSGAATLIRQNLFIDLGGYDQSLNMWLEDADLALRLVGAGHLTGLVPFELEHIGGHSLRDRDSIQAKAYLMARNRVWILRGRFTRSFQMTLGLVTILAMFANALTRKTANGTCVAYLAGMWNGSKFRPPLSEARIQRFGLSDFRNRAKANDTFTKIGG